MIKRDSFRVYREDWTICIVSKCANRVLAISAKGTGTSLTGCARIGFISATFVLNGVSANA
jgi:hypothetical protein